MALSVDDHERYCGMVCIICYKKGKKSLTDAQTKYIASNLIKGFELGNPYFPSAICVNCNILVNGKINGKDVALPAVEYDPGNVEPLLRGIKCECKICKVAKSSINS